MSAARRRVPKGAQPNGRLILDGAPHIETWAPDLLRCSRCGAEVKLGAGVGSSLVGDPNEQYRRTREWGRAARSFLDEHRACKEVE